MNLKKLKHLVAAGALLASAMLSSSSVSAAVIEQNLLGTATSAPVYFGQSFTTSSSGPWNTVTFNFYSPDQTPLAVGTGYLFTSPYSGSPNGLASAGALATSVLTSGGLYQFDPNFVLAPLTQYFFYADAPMTLRGDGNFYDGGRYYFTFEPNGAFGNGNGATDVNFSVNGNVVPEPSAIALLGIALMSLFGFGLMRRRADA